MLLLLIGPPGAGKTTIETELVKAGIPRLRSHTTRPRRPKESDAAYYFVSPAEFAAADMVEETTYNGNKYGLCRAEVEKYSDALAVAVVEINGAKQLRRVADCRLVFIDAPTIDLVRRLRERGTPDIDDRIKLIPKDRDSKWYCDAVIDNADGKLERTVNTILWAVHTWNKASSRE